MRSNLQRRLAVALGAVLVLLAIAVGVQWRNTLQVDATAESVAHAREVLGALELVLRLNVDAETGLRGYVLSGDEQFLDPFVKARQELGPALAYLRELASDNPAQLQRIAALEKDVEEHLQFRESVTVLVRDQGVDAARREIQDGQGKARVDKIRAGVAAIRAAEEDLLQQRDLASQQADRRAQGTLALLAALMALVVIGTYVTLRRSLRARMRAEEALRESEESLSITLGSIGDAVLATDVEGRVTRMNPVAEQLTGWALAEARGARVSAVFRIINEETRAPAEIPVDRVLATGKVQGLANHTVLIARDGTECAIADSAAPIRRTDGEVVGVVLVFRDVTEERRAEVALRRLTETLDERVRERTAELQAVQQDLERRVADRTEELRFATEELESKNAQLEQANRLKSEFLANMSHELRTPLNAIIGFSEVLRSGLAGELTPRQREFAGDINSSGAHLLSLISDILDLSKIEAGSMTLEREELSMVPLLESCLGVVRDKAIARGIELRTEIDAALGAIEGDARKLKQIAYNLLSNAVKFTDAGGRVTLTARRVDRSRIDHASLSAGRLLRAPSVADRAFVEIGVQDTGIGIAATDLARLFEPFVQVDASMKRRHDGTGLGLALVRRLVELHGGGLAVESAAGRGSRFTVWLPYRSVAQRPEEARTAAPATQVRVVAGEGGMEGA
jgi:PAS domain S-box-containing protein